MKRHTRHDRRVAEIETMLLEADYRLWHMVNTCDRSSINAAERFIDKLRSPETRQLLESTRLAPQRARGGSDG